MRTMSKQLPNEEFDALIQSKIKEGNFNPNDSDRIDTEDDIMKLKTMRFMDCICIKDGDDIRLLCDDKRSIMRTNSQLNLAILRTFKCSAE